MTGSTLLLLVVYASGMLLYGIIIASSVAAVHGSGPKVARGCVRPNDRKPARASGETIMPIDTRRFPKQEAQTPATRVERRLTAVLAADLAG